MKIYSKVITALAFLCLGLESQAQSVISGTVVDQSGQPVPFAVLGLKNTGAATTAGADGTFKFRAIQNGKYLLQSKSIGYREKTDSLDLSHNESIVVQMESSALELDEVAVNAGRVDNTNAMAYNNVDAEQIAKQNLGQDAPYVLNTLPNIVVNSDAGNGVGYTGLRVRGTDPTRVNVTINGVPVNDAESQGTFWVDMPDLLSSTNNIQVQRGVGTSVNGAGAFGASINFQTNELNEKPYAKLISTAGSFDTYRNTLSAGTGLMNGKFSLDARASSIVSQGYIDRASSNLKSYYLAAGYYGKSSVLKFINFSGWEKTYQAWNYVPMDSIHNGNRTYNSCGEYYDSNGNVHYYDNETDNYNQNNSQLHFIQTFNSRLSLNLIAHYTKGKGYYEQYKQGQNLANYGIAPAISAGGDTITNTDLIRRLWLDNDFSGMIMNVNYKASSDLSFIFGGGYNTYFGKHYGTVQWARYASSSEIGHQYGMNSANKNDANAYLKTNYRLMENMHVFLDLQMRSVEYSFLGFTDSILPKMQNASYSFFNPKLGLSYDVSNALNVYASVSRANKEPNRDDFVQSSKVSRPLPEQLTDLEAGAKFRGKKVYLAANLYWMDYKNQLVLNGQINNVGAYNRVNVASSYRGGVELEMSLPIGKYLDLGGNLAFSQNKIRNFNEYLDSLDVNYEFISQAKRTYATSDISFSPSMVSSILAVVKPVKNLEISFIQKNVGRQYLDNTSNKHRSISPYSLLDIRLNYHIQTKLIPELGFMLSVYNVFSQNYSTNGYTYSYYTGQTLNTYNFYAPAAPINFMGGISLKF